MNKYKQLIEKHQKEFNAIEKFFAFNESQFKEGLKKLNCKKDDITRINGVFFIRKIDVNNVKELLTRQTKELNTAIKNDKTGLGFIKDMFLYELDNHEYMYTYDLTDTLNSLGFSKDDILNDKSLHNGLTVAIKELRSY